VTARGWDSTLVERPSNARQARYAGCLQLLHDRGKISDAFWLARAIRLSQPAWLAAGVIRRFGTPSQLEVVDFWIAGIVITILSAPSPKGCTSSSTTSALSGAKKMGRGWLGWKIAPVGTVAVRIQRDDEKSVIVPFGEGAAC
jgi:hypothetical protein